MTLLVDVGTNAEIVLGNRHRLLACSSPTGPAFEGAQISCGQRAAPGAIERVRIDRRDARAAVQGDRLRPVVGRSGVSPRQPRRPASRASAARASSKSSPRCTSRASSLSDGVIDGSLADAQRRASSPNGRTYSYVLHSGAQTLQHHAERRARDPAREGRAACRHPAAHGPARRRPRRTHPAAGRFRHAHRRQVRCGARHDSGLRPRARDVGGQCGGHRGADRAARFALARDDRGRSYGASRRSRPRSSRSSRRTSSMRWRSRTGPRTTRISARSSTCRSQGPRRQPADERRGRRSRRPVTTQPV